jgi:hypothetical protein
MLIVVQTFRNVGEASSRPVRARPIVGQFEVSYRVWCSKALRTAWPINSLFLVSVTRVQQAGKQAYLRISLDEPWERVSEQTAKQFVKKNFRGGGK